MTTTRSVLARTVRGAGWVIAWRLGMRVLGLISTLILVRLLAPADFGLLALAAPVLGLHGTADPVSPLDVARERYRQAPRAELISIAGGVHDVLNDVTHRTVAATIVQFLERLRLGADLPPIAISEKL